MDLFISELFWIGCLLLFFGVGFFIALLQSQRSVWEELIKIDNEKVKSKPMKLLFWDILITFCLDYIKILCVIVLSIGIGLLIIISEIFNFQMRGLTPPSLDGISF
ncbi:hypothetical protein M670_05000 [Schinkia azotoformans MEV2011]|uniref:Uncharacterized protein n=3 Tax=Schinkia azotoformans TaxID=1454 RepID=A0A072NFX9_SCHAZ|nr:hypothetical protein [Schinkia azotoformans]KEF35838.1 hypothetical protein M670_05000 [Schinkia azotoformans MEV2011]MEC1782201.1 hypothetical protein [Schinkia azotoformans]MED4331666.1 hypothetical protein [Schinkia azotoformans]